LDLKGFMEYLAKHAVSRQNHDMARAWLQFQQLPTFQAMPTPLRDEVDALLRSGTYGPTS
jgi:hypothetical protein